MKEEKQGVKGVKEVFDMIMVSTFGSWRGEGACEEALHAQPPTGPEITIHQCACLPLTGYLHEGFAVVIFAAAGMNYLAANAVAGKSYG